MTEQLSQDELAAYFALRTAGDRMQRAVSTQLREHGLSEVQFSVLARLGASDDGLRMSDLASALVASKSGLTYQAGQLEARGLVARRGDAGDERSVVVRLTPEGSALLGQVLPGHQALVRSLFLDRLDAGELEAIRQGLQKVARED